MTQQKEGRLPNFAFADVSGMGKQNFEGMAAMQKQFLDAMNNANREWLACLNEEATLTSNFTKRIASAGNIPEAAAAYQEWASQQMELMSRQAKRVLDETQNFSKSFTHVMGNGGRMASS